MQLLTSTVYDVKTGTLDEHVMTMRSFIDKLKHIGVVVPDDVFAIHLANSMPLNFSDVLISFEGRLLEDPMEAVSACDIT